MNAPINRRQLLLEIEAGLAEKERRDLRKAHGGPGGLIKFIKHFWHILEPETPFVDGWPLWAICEHLEAVAFGEITRLLITVPPGFCKSLITDVFFPAWLWGPMDRPHTRFAAFSYSVGLTERDNGKFRDLLMHKDFQNLYGKRFLLRKTGEVKVTNDKTGSKLASSVGGVSTGERADIVLCDDLHNIKEADSDAVRTETVRWFKEALSNRLNNMETSSIICIMQRVHEVDVAGVILEEMDGYCHLMIQMEYDTSTIPADYEGTQIGWKDPRVRDGELAWPTRFPPSVIASLKRDLGPYAYASQYQQSPVARGGNILKQEWWQTWGQDEALRYGLTWDDRPNGRKEMPPSVEGFVVASLDTAYTVKTSNDASALTIWGPFDDLSGSRKVILLYAWAERLELPELVERVAETCRKYKVRVLLIEDKAAGLPVMQQLRRLYEREMWQIRMVTPVLDKVARVHSVVHLFADKMIYAPDTPWAQALINECSSFPRGAHDDRVDATTQGIKWMRDNGLLERNDEQRAETEAFMKYKPKSESLYPGC